MIDKKALDLKNPEDLYYVESLSFDSCVIDNVSEVSLAYQSLNNKI